VAELELQATSFQDFGNAKILPSLNTGSAADSEAPIEGICPKPEFVLSPRR
tara:strand:+ start:475 stop:627 length:153 start_codon:yes stop_codon:yes gene_type:complete